MNYNINAELVYIISLNVNFIKYNHFENTIGLLLLRKPRLNEIKPKYIKKYDILINPTYIKSINNTTYIKSFFKKKPYGYIYITDYTNITEETIKELFINEKYDDINEFDYHDIIINNLSIKYADIIINKWINLYIKDYSNILEKYSNSIVKFLQNMYNFHNSNNYIFKYDKIILQNVIFRIFDSKNNFYDILKLYLDSNIPPSISYILYYNNLDILNNNYTCDYMYSDATTLYVKYINGFYIKYNRTYNILTEELDGRIEEIFYNSDYKNLYSKILNNILDSTIIQYLQGRELSSIIVINKLQKYSTRVENYNLIYETKNIINCENNDLDDHEVHVLYNDNTIIKYRRSNSGTVLGWEFYKDKWSILGYSEQYKTLCSLENNYLLSNQICQYLINYNSIVTIVNSYGDNNNFNIVLDKYNILVKSDNQFCTYSQYKKCWVTKQKYINICPSHKIQNKINDNIDTYCDEYIKIWNIKPWIKPNQYINTNIRDTYNIEFNINYFFTNKKILYYALDNNLNLIILGKSIIKFILYEYFLCGHGFFSTNITNHWFKYKNIRLISKRWLEKGLCEKKLDNLYCDIDTIDKIIAIICCNSSIARASILIELYTYDITYNNWESFMSRLHSNYIAEKFYALIAAVLLDNTFNNSHLIIINIIEIYLLNDIPKKYLEYIHIDNLDVDVSNIIKSHIENKHIEINTTKSSIPIKKKYICKKCKMTFDSNTLYMKHLKGSKNICNIGNNIFNTSILGPGGLWINKKYQ